VAGLEGPSDARNLALACARCNQQKGRGPDAAGPGDARARAIVRTLLDRRAERYIEDAR
jgi:HNH endonuclease